uniref:Uclacyanin-2 n=1 Tax=Zea mays TaxID=4577 RepID=B6SQI9_MAIZE|nr:uclacyanin-2 precursor [Zea mays]|eukprot:NP_001147368.1 uclacyanin-2 precursor [Zea mays]
MAMAMAKASILATFAAVAALAAVQLAAAADHPVGGDGSWDASGTTGYDAWSAKQTFKQGDTLSFKFAPSHDVTEVSKAGYDACSGSNPVKSYTGGSASVKLSAPGKRYFICSVPGHCAAGMKLEVTVAAAAVTAAPAPAKTTKPRHQRSVSPTPAPAAAPSTDEMPTVSSPTAAPAPKSSDASTLGAKAVVGLAVATMLTFLAM